MPHEVDGFDLTFTSRTSWKAERRHAGRKVDVVPVTWTKGLRRAGDEMFLEVWFRKPSELESFKQSREPFVVALAKAKDYSQMPHQFDTFNALFRVVSTGNLLSDKSIDTRVLERVKA